MTQIILINCRTLYFVSTQPIFSQIQVSRPDIFFTVKSPSVTQRSVSQENAFKKSKNQSLFCRKTICSNNSFTLIENNFRFFKIAKFEFKVKVHYNLWQNAPSCDPLNCFFFLSSRRKLQQLTVVEEDKGSTR